MGEKVFIPADPMTGAGYFVDRGYTPGTYPNLNDKMTDEQRAAFTAHVRGERISLADDGTPYIENQGMSVQSVEEAVRLEQARRMNLGS